MFMKKPTLSGYGPLGRVGEHRVPEAASVVPRRLLRSRSRHLIPYAECGPLAEPRLWRGAGFQPAALTRPLAFSVLALGRPRRCFPAGASFSRQKGASPGAAGGEPRRTRRGSGPGWLPGPALRLGGRQTSCGLRFIPRFSRPQFWG
ncbi:uncharacterized protein LOC108303359 [Cebus imitator]|uniref:uncharacterized protein LOC108303359 n=1 Tax=Cebus imitator TaxID=2715852 RepID=UPI000809BDAB|nr:uncharacterized protein LOC108303359 [Cebus imitator]